MINFKPLKRFKTFERCSPDGGIGRRSRLKICRSQGCAGSIPVLGTEYILKALIVSLSGLFNFTGDKLGGHIKLIKMEFLQAN